MAIVEVVKYGGSADTLAWKYPNEELCLGTQLIVNEAQEAVFVKEGRIFDIFSSGRYTLSTENIPILNKVVNIPFGGRSPFTAEIWYVNKACILDVKWGTSTPIQLQDPKYGIFVPVRSFGQFAIQVKEPQKFFTKLVGTLSSFDQQCLVKYFRGLYITRVKDVISTYLVHKQISILEINAYLNELSDFMHNGMNATMEQYGINLINFLVNDISVPEGDSGVMRLKEALAKKAEMNIIGYNYQQERSFDTMESAAQNPGSASPGIMGAGIGLGMGAKLGATMGNSFDAVTKEVSSNRKKCSNCQEFVEESKRYCSSCGFDTMKSAEKTKLTCNECGMLMDEKVKFCSECGSKYSPCPKCGVDLPEGAKSCNNCGYTAPIECSHCGTLIEKKVKFCPECGVSLVKTCPKCKIPIENASKFCPDCGEKLTEE